VAAPAESSRLRSGKLSMPPQQGLGTNGEAVPTASGQTAAQSNGDQSVASMPGRALGWLCWLVTQSLWGYIAKNPIVSRQGTSRQQDVAGQIGKVLSPGDSLTGRGWRGRREMDRGRISAVANLFWRMKQVGRIGAQTLQQCSSHWTRPAPRGLTAGTAADLLRSKPQLVAENALLRQQLLILRSPMALAGHQRV
jgi:hypothetical protein